MLGLKAKPSETLERRQKLVDELQQCTMSDAPVRKLEAEEKALQEQLRDLRNRMHKLNAARIVEAHVVQTNRQTIERELLATAPAAIREAIAALAIRVEDATGALRTTSRGDRWFSNRESINGFCTAARAATIELEQLRFAAVDDATIGKAISKILRKLPSLNIEQVEVTK